MRHAGSRANMPAMRRLIALLGLVLLAPAGAYAASAPTVVYRGRTAGRSLVTLKVRAGRVTSFQASVYASCGLSNLLITVAYPPTGRRGASAPIRDGAFRVAYRSDPTLEPEDDRRTIAGRVGRRGASGTIKIAGLCSAATTWSARRS